MKRPKKKKYNQSYLPQSIIVKTAPTAMTGIAKPWMAILSYVVASINSKEVGIPSS